MIAKVKFDEPLQKPYPLLASWSSSLKRITLKKETKLLTPMTLIAIVAWEVTSWLRHSNTPIVNLPTHEKESLNY